MDFFRLGIRDLEIGTDFTLSYNIFMSEIGKAALNGRRGENRPGCCYRGV